MVEECVVQVKCHCVRHRRLLIVKRNERDTRKNRMVCSHDYLIFDRRAASFASLSFSVAFYRFSVIVAISIPYLCVATWTVIYNATHLMVDDDNYANAFAIRSDFRFSIVKHLKKLNKLFAWYQSHRFFIKSFFSLQIKLQIKQLIIFCRDFYQCEINFVRNILFKTIYLLLKQFYSTLHLLRYIIASILHIFSAHV